VEALNRTDLARLLDVALTTIDSFVAAGMPGRKGDDGGWRFDLSECLPWYREYLMRSANRTSNSDYQQAKTAKECALAELAQMKVEQQKGSLVAVEWAAKQVSDVLSEARAALLAVPNLVASDLSSISDADEIRQKLELAIHSAMERVHSAVDSLTSS